MKIENLPFYWRIRKNLRDKNIVSDFLPFEVDYDPAFGLVIQKRNRHVRKSLDTVYKKFPNIGNIQQNNTWSESYKKDFEAFIEKHIPPGKKGMRILEIGCGGCLILADLKKKGHEVVGIDPSPYSVVCGKKLGVAVVQDFYPSKKIKGSFDLIFHSDVIEHMEKPSEFLRNIHGRLRKNGIHIIAIPDSGPNLKTGDISIFLHQHMNYFDRESFRSIIAGAGFGSIVIEKAKWGGSLYLRAFKKSPSQRPQALTPDRKRLKYHRFIRKAEALTKRMKKEVDEILSDKKRSLGFWAPVRTLPYLGLWNVFSGFRFFDDTVYWHGKYFDGIDIPVENFEDIRKLPVTDIFIMSPTFGDVIERKIKGVFGKRIRIRKLTDFFKP